MALRNAMAQNVKIWTMGMSSARQSLVPIDSLVSYSIVIQFEGLLLNFQYAHIYSIGHVGSITQQSF